MAYETRDNTGSLFTNDRKTSENQPDFRGKCVVDGVEKEVSGWKKQGRNGEWISLSFKEPFQKDAQAAPKPQEKQREQYNYPLASEGRGEQIEDGEVPF